MSDTDFTIQRQTLSEIDITYNDENDQPLDLSGYTAKLSLKDPDTGEVAQTLDSEASSGSRIVISTASPPDGTITLIFTTADTAELEVKSYKYDLGLKLGGEVVRPISGFISVIDFTTDML